MSSLLELQKATEQATVRGDVAALEACCTALEKIGTVEGRALLARVRGQIAYIQGNLGAALTNYTQAYSLFEELADQRSMASSLGNIGSVHFGTGSYSDALKFFLRALEGHTKLNDAPGIARVSNNLALVHAETGDFPAALEYFHSALSTHLQLNNKRGIALATGNIGIVYSSAGNYPDALKQFHEALAVYEDSGDLTSAAGVLGNIGNVHNTTGNYSTALEYYQRTYDLHKQAESMSGMANVLGNIGNAYYCLKQYDLALDHMERSLTMYRNNGEHAGAAATAGNMLLLFLADDRLDQARELLATMSAMQILEPATHMHVAICRAHLAEHDGDIAQSINILRDALETAERIGLKKEQAELHKRIRDLCQHTNDFAGYIEHNNAFTQLQEEINGKDVSVRLALQDKQREIDAKDREVLKHMAVLHSTLPKHVAERVARGEVVNDSFENAAVLFLDVVGFTTLSSTLSASDVVQVLQSIFTSFDAVCATHNVVKIKTIGDAYMAVAFPDEDNTQYERLAHCALDMLNVDAPNVSFRIGLHCGPIVAGVLGTERLQYDVWGDTVNVASRMESAGEAGRVHVSEAFASNLKSNTEYTKMQNSMSESENTESHEVSLVTSHSSLVTIDRGSIDIKGKGLMQTYWLEGA